MSFAITIGYCFVAFLLFNRGTHPGYCALHRATNVFMGLAVLCFGTGRFILATTGVYTEWLFLTGHFAFFVFAWLYLWRGEWPMLKGKR